LKFKRKLEISWRKIYNASESLTWTNLTYKPIFYITQLPQKILLTSKVIKSDPKITNSLQPSKSLTHLGGQSTKRFDWTIIKKFMKKVVWSKNHHLLSFSKNSIKLYFSRREWISWAKYFGQNVEGSNKLFLTRCFTFSVHIRYFPTTLSYVTI